MSSDDPSGQFESGGPEAGGLDIGALLQQAQAMQQQLVEAQQAAAEQVVEGQAGGGAVRIRVTGGLQFEQVSINPAALDPEDVAMLEDLVVAACNDAVAQAQALNQQALGSLDTSALGLPGLPGLPGSPGPPPAIG
ncbi:MAG TPA: YbaB/EbfC family nucleoid-associated protein [Acidimicrobiales bacterium]|nr:YbaB/EbfC family nucleoid-associated protein [Acidimicrobiales bacterium]